MGFAWQVYVSKYPDLQRAGINTEAKALAHWNRYGRKEGRTCTPSTNLVNVQSLIPDIHVDMRYATTNNIFHTKLYSEPVCMLHRTTAMALKKVQEECKIQGLSLKIWDAYRPHRIAKQMFNIIKNTKFVSYNSLHCRGSSVDLTLVKDGKELLMPSAFDDFTKKAGESNENSRMLKSLMQKHGFTNYTHEWWHFDFRSSLKYPLLDVPI